MYVTAGWFSQWYELTWIAICEYFTFHYTDNPVKSRPCSWHNAGGTFKHIHMMGISTFVCAQLLEICPPKYWPCLMPTNYYVSQWGFTFSIHICLTQPNWVNPQVFDFLTHGGRVTHICVSNLTIIDSDICLPPIKHEAILCTMGLFADT